MRVHRNGVYGAFAVAAPTHVDLAPDVDVENLLVQTRACLVQGVPWVLEMRGFYLWIECEGCETRVHMSVFEYT